MNILLLIFLYFMVTQGGKLKDSEFLRGINLEKFSPLVSLFTGGNLNLQSLLQSDLLKDINIAGINMSKILPILELYNNLKSGGLFSKKNVDEKTADTEKKSDSSSDFPLPAISEIADKNITYSLSQYLSRN